MSGTTPSVIAFLVALGRTAIALALLLGCSVVVGPAHAQAPASMGALVLMRADGDAGAESAIAAALAHPEPGMRTVAARLAAVGRMGSLRQNVRDALWAETDETAAREQARALFITGPAASMELLDGYLARTTVLPGAVIAYAHELARHTPDAFVERVPRLVAATGADRARDLAPAVHLLVAQQPAHADAAWRAWFAHAPGRAWALSLSRAHLPPVTVLINALASDDVEVRESTVWFIVSSVAARVDMPRAVVDEAARSRAEASDWETIGRELMARHARVSAPVDRSGLIATSHAGTARRRSLSAINGTSLLLPAEQAVVRKIVGDPPREVTSPSPTEPDVVPLMRTPENLWPGFLASLANEVRCRPGGWTFGAVRITYAADGRPSAFGVDRGQLSEACARMAAALAHVTLIAPGMRLDSGAAQWLIVPAAREYIECADAPRPGFGLLHRPADPDADTRPVVEPKKTRNVAPRYPPNAQQQRVAGVVILEATITTSGCVTAMHTVRSVDPFLAMEAMRTVLQWRYSPTLIDGRAVDTSMTVTVNFTLRP